MEWVPPKPRLQRGGVALRPFQANDAAAVASACRDPDILRFTFMKDGLTETEAGEWIETGNEWWPKGHPRFAVVDAHDNHLLGQVGLNFNFRHASAEANYWVDAGERGRGVASRALSLIIAWGFSKGIERVFLLIHPENEPSNRLAAKLGSPEQGSSRPTNPSRIAALTWCRGPSCRVTRAPGMREPQILCCKPTRRPETSRCYPNALQAIFAACVHVPCAEAPLASEQSVT